MKNIKDIHDNKKCLIVGNAWDNMSALIMEKQGFDIIGTTSWGVANSLGCNDGEKISFDDYLTVIKNMLNVISIPLSIDIESGFGSTDKQIIENVLHLAKIGCAGINIEDSDTNYALKSKDAFASLIESIKNELNLSGYNGFFVNARIDAYIALKENQLEESIERATLYQSYGADGIFIPLLSDDDEIKNILGHIDIPLNVMSLPNLTDIKELTHLGVKRFSFGNAMSDYIVATIENLSEKILEKQNTSTLYNHNDIKTTFNN